MDTSNLVQFKLVPRVDVGGTLTLVNVLFLVLRGPFFNWYFSPLASLNQACRFSWTADRLCDCRLIVHVTPTRFAAQKKCQETCDTGESAANGDMAIKGDNIGPCTAGNTEGGGPSRLLDPPVEAAVASPPKTIAERIETVKAEEADLLRRFEITHERYAKVRVTRKLQMKLFYAKVLSW